jgi:hypothetical protein
MQGLPSPGGKTYWCSKYKKYGLKACSRNTVREAAVLDAVMGALLDEVLSPARLDAAEAEVEHRLQAERRSGEADRIRHRADQLAKKVKDGNARLLLLPEDRIPGVVAQLREWEGERKGLLDRLADLDNGGAEVKAVLAEARRQLWRLREGLLADDVEAQAAVVREVVSKAEVRFRPGTGRTRNVPVGLRLYVRPGLAFDVPLDESSLASSATSPSRSL